MHVSDLRKRHQACKVFELVIMELNMMLHALSLLSIQQQVEAGTERLMLPPAWAAPMGINTDTADVPHCYVQV